MESAKFGRKYFLSVVDLRTGEKTVKAVGLPFTTKFSINRTWGTMAGHGTIQIYNLNKDTRSFMRKDQTDLGQTHLVSILAGYENELSTLMEGYLQLGYSVRQGVDYITTLNISDLGNAFMNATFSGTFREGTSIGTIVKALAKALDEYGIKTGVISKDFSTKSKRGTSLTGKAVDLINELTGGQFFVDKGVINVLSDDQYIDGEVLLINSRYGLLGKPRREGQNVVLNMILEPRAFVGQRAVIKLENNDDDYNGNYYVRSVSHNGTISEVIGESVTTELYLTQNKFGRLAT